MAGRRRESPQPNRSHHVLASRSIPLRPSPHPSGFSNDAHLKLTFLEALLYLWGWALILDEYYQYRTASRSVAEHFSSLWNW